MSSEVITTSQWIAFFRKAGLPPTISANYAIIFSDNRIQLDMLLDLSKEYLYDMGIKVMGDVIAILKYAKEFNHQLVKEKVIGAGGARASPINKAVAERIVERYARRSPQPPVQTIQSLQTNVISLKRKSSPATVAKRARGVPPEEEGAYRIKMPTGSTERTRKIMQMQSRQPQGKTISLTKGSVFSRLGDSAVSSSTDLNKTSSVFERLGPSSGKRIPITCDELPSSTVVERPAIKGSALPYRGVLKADFEQKRTVLSNAPFKEPIITRTVMQSGPSRTQKIVRTANSNQINQIQNLLTGHTTVRRTVNSGGAGILGDRVQKSNVKNRLGQKMDTRNTARARMLGNQASPQKKNTVFARLQITSPQKKNATVFNRLQMASPQKKTVFNRLQMASPQKKAVFNRLQMASPQKKKAAVFNRLNKQKNNTIFDRLG